MGTSLPAKVGIFFHFFVRKFAYIEKNAYLCDEISKTQDVGATR